MNRPLTFTDPTGHWYYEPACDCLAATSEAYNEHPGNLNIPHRIEGRPWMVQEELHAITYSSYELGIGDKEAGEQAASASCAIFADCRWKEKIDHMGGADYMTAEISGGMGVMPPWLGINVDVTRDRYGNWYAGAGLNVGKSFPTFGTIKGVGGLILETHILSEQEIEGFIRGMSFNAGGGFVGGGGVMIPLSSPLRIAFEPGLYSPQIGAGLTWMGLMYNANSPNPWFWQN